MSFELNAQKRTLQGSSASRRLRRSGKVPGIVYGGDSQPLSIELDHNTLLLSLRKEAFHSSLISLSIDGARQDVLLRDVQTHAYKPQVLHIDFQRVTSGVMLHKKVPVHFVGAEKSPGVKLGHGISSHTMTEIEIECLPKDLPEFIEVDMSALELGQSIHINELKLPAGVKVITHGHDDMVVAAVLPPQKEESGETADAAAKEPEVVTKKAAKGE